MTKITKHEQGWQIASDEDASVNFTVETWAAGYEARYVRRQTDYIACYLSSAPGCSRQCRMCHLTATKQVRDTPPATVETMILQARTVLDYYAQLDGPRATVVHFNFMARGEPLDNSAVSYDLLCQLAELAAAYRLLPKFNISTILPKNCRGFVLADGADLARRFSPIPPTIYYSVYSLDDDFRKRWLPNAMPVSEAGPLLRRYQQLTGARLKLHWAFIKGENDSVEQTVRLAWWIKDLELDCSINIVRYNPFSPEYGEESDEDKIERRANTLRDKGLDVHVVPRVGFDVKASCGMFLDNPLDVSTD